MTSDKVVQGAASGWMCGREDLRPKRFEFHREREIVMLNQIGTTERDQVSKMHGCIWSKREE